MKVRVWWSHGGKGPCVGGAMEVHVRVWWSHGGKGLVEP